MTQNFVQRIPRVAATDAHELGAVTFKHRWSLYPDWRADNWWAMLISSSSTTARRTRTFNPVVQCSLCCSHSTARRASLLRTDELRAATDSFGEAIIAEVSKSGQCNMCFIWPIAIVHLSLSLFLLLLLRDNLREWEWWSIRDPP